MIHYLYMYRKKDWCITWFELDSLDPSQGQDGQLRLKRADGV